MVTQTQYGTISLMYQNPHLFLYLIRIWRNAVYDEYNALIKNGTWLLIPRPSGANIVWCLWLFRHKFRADGSLSQYKARLVTNGSSQQLGIDCDETFSPVVKLATIHIVLSLALTRHRPIHQLDVKNAFLNGDLSETIYASTSGFYGSSVSSSSLLQNIIFSLHREFDMTDLGALNHFLGISVTHDTTGMFLSQKRYAMELPKRAHMLNCNPTRTPVDTDSKLICLYMHDPCEPHLAALKRILCYIRGTLEFVLQLYASSESSLVAYSDADWAGCPTTHRSTSGVANVVAETTWLRNLLRELHTPLLTATLVYCDNVSAVYLSANPVQHQRTKHIEIDIHFVRDMVAIGHVRVLRVPSCYQYADIFTKGLPSALFE
ncbi:ribonuclease H-like domain-containing protein [Tanacetum coccineum]